MYPSMCMELRTVGRFLATLALTGLAAAGSLHADSCITLKPATADTGITVSQNEGGVTIRVAGSANISGDTASYAVSSDAGGVVWTAALAADTTVSISRAGGIVKVCQTDGARAAVIQAPAAPVAQPLASPDPTKATTPTAEATPSAGAVKPATPAPAARQEISSGSATAHDSQAKTNTKDQPAATGDSAGAKPASEQEQKAAQEQLNDPEQVVAAGVQGALKAGSLASAQARFAHDFAPYVLHLASPTISRRILSDAEEKRIDQQVSTTQPSTGTSVASKGSVPWLLGFAAEAGALTQSTSNNVLTFNGTPANIVKALKAKDYLASYSVGDNTPLVKWLFTPLSFSVSFNVAQSSSSNNSSGGGVSMAGTMSGAPASSTTTGANGTLAGYTIRYSIWNHRDARDPRYQAIWNEFVDQNAQAMLEAVTSLVDALTKDPKYQDAFARWRVDTQNTISRLDMTEPEIKKAFDQQAEALRKIVGNDTVLRNLVDDAAQSIEHYADTRNNILTSISNSTAVAFEYTETQQSNLLGSPVTVTNSNPAVSNPIPNLSTFNFVVEKGSVGATQFTANASTTIYNTIPLGTHIGRVRDYRAAVQADIPLPEITNVGMPVFTFAGLFMSLVNQPLGQMVVVNDVPISLTGNIWLFQSKLSLKVKNSGVKIPVALTYTNRTELNKESDVRGSIGVTYSLDNLFANSK